jgi:hypothetical protein
VLTWLCVVIFSRIAPLFEEYPRATTSSAISTQEFDTAMEWIRVIGLREYQAAAMLKANNARQKAQQLAVQGAHTYTKEDTPQGGCIQNSSTITVLPNSMDSERLANHGDNSPIRKSQIGTTTDKEEPNTPRTQRMLLPFSSMPALHQERNNRDSPTVSVASDLHSTILATSNSHSDSYNTAKGRPLAGIKLRQGLDVLADICEKIEHISK